MPLTLTLDLEDSEGRHDPEGRWVAATDRFLELAASVDARATIFVVGEAAAAAPGLIAKIAAAGHEIGLHGYRHVPLASSGPDQLPEELRRGRALLQDLTGQEVAGFRAPIFSLTPAASWAVDVLREAGFTYSSSVLPAHSPLHGWPGVPQRPFAWSNGLVELPCPVTKLGPATVPYLGGIYLRYVPMRLATKTLGHSDGQPWSYVHPYDFDHGAPLRRFPHANWPTSLLLHTRRRATAPCLRRLVAAAGGAGPPLQDVVAGLDHAAVPTVTAS